MDLLNPLPSRDDRRVNRIDIDAPVLLKVFMTQTDDVQTVRGRLRDIGLGGLYVETETELPEGALADLDLELAGKKMESAVGLVRWYKPGVGAGIEFFYTTDEERDEVETVVAEWIQRKGGATNTATG